MKKKLLGILFCGILLAGLTGCNSKIDQNVNLSVKEGTLTNSSVTLILKNDSKTNYSYSEPYYIEQKKDNNWQKLETIHDEVFNQPAWGLASGKSVEINISWVYSYGQLESGKYRIVKEIFKSSSANINNNVSFNVYAEFDEFSRKEAMQTVYNKSNQKFTPDGLSLDDVLDWLTKEDNIYE